MTWNTDILKHAPVNRERPAKVRRDHDGRFNCISWAAGVTDRWTWDDDRWGDYVEDPDDARQGLRDFFADLGYQDVGPREKFHPDQDYVILIAYKGEKGHPSHAARWDPETGLWTTKDGDGPLRECHTWQDAVGHYGEAYHVMTRPHRPEARLDHWTNLTNFQFQPGRPRGGWAGNDN